MYDTSTILVVRSKISGRPTSHSPTASYPQPPIPIFSSYILLFANPNLNIFVFLCNKLLQLISVLSVFVSTLIVITVFVGENFNQ